MDNPKNEEISYKDNYIIHFIVTHDMRRNFNTIIYTKYKDKNDIIEYKLLFQHKFNYNNAFYISKIYSFKIPISKNNYDIYIRLYENRDNDETICEKKITEKEIKNKKEKYFFLFNINFKTNKDGDSKNIIIPLNIDDEYQLYKAAFKNNYNKIEDYPIYEGFLLSVYKYFEENKKFTFSFYISFLTECYNTNLINNYILLFKYQKISKLGDFDEYLLEKFKKIINENQNIIINNIYGHEKKEKLLDRLLKIILYFNYNFHKKEGLDSMFNESETNKKLFKIIKKHLSLFPDFSLSKKKISELIQNYNKLNEIKEILSYNRNCLELLEIIDENKDYIMKIFMSEKKDSKKINECIQIDKLTMLKDGDDLDKILKMIQKLVEFENNNGTFFLSFSKDFFQMIIILSNGLDLNILFDIKNTIDNYMKKIDKNFKKELDLTIHKTGMKFINIGKIKNIQILDFIQKDLYYNTKIYEKSPERNLNILAKIEIDEIDKEFIDKWNKIDWTSIFKNQENNFYETICSLTKNLKDFNILFKLLYEPKKFDKIKVINCMQNEFLNNYTNCPLDELNDNSDIILNLIYYYDKSRADLNNYVKELNQKINKEFLNNLYMKILNNKTDLTDNTKELLNDSIDLDSFDNIIRVIQHLNKNTEKILSKIKKYLIEEKDFLRVKDSFNMVIFKKLVNLNILKDNQDDDNTFIQLTLQQIEQIKLKFITLDYSFNEISSLLDKPNNDIFLERLCLLHLIKEKEIPSLKNDSDSIYNNIIIITVESANDKYNKKKAKIDKLQLIYDDYLTFFPNSCKDKIEQIEKLIDKIKNENINQIISRYEDEIKSFEKNSLEQAKERRKKKESLFFKAIFLKERYNKKDDDNLILKKTTLKFEELKDLFENNEINYNNEKIVNKFIKEFNNKSDDEIKEEILKLIDLFNITIKKEKIDEGIYNLILLSNKTKIYKISNSIIEFIKRTGAIKEEYTETLIAIVNTPTKTLEINYTKVCLEILKTLDIDLFNKENIFLKIMLEFSKCPQIIQFLISKTYEDCRALQDITNNTENTFLTTGDILDFEKCVNFMNKIGTQAEIKKMTDYDLIQKTKFLSETNTELEKNLNNFIQHFNQILKVISIKFNKKEAANEIIENIFNNTIFKLSSKEKNYFKGNIGKEEIKLNNLQELRERILISTNIYHESTKIKNICQKYIRFVSILFKIIDKLNEIYNIGYTREINIQITINNNNISFRLDPNFLNIKYNNNKKINNIEEILTILNNILNEIKESQIRGYNENVYLRYIYGRQFYYIYNYLNEIDLKYDIKSFIKYITNNQFADLDFKIKSNEFNLIEDINNYYYCINHCSKFIKDIFDKKQIDFNDIYKNAKIRPKKGIKDIKGFFVYLCSQVETKIFNWK